MKRSLSAPVLVFLLLASHISVCAQSDLHQPVEAVRKLYQQNLGAGSALYTGKVYERYWAGIKGNPFFLSDQFVQGSVTYQGTSYENIPLLYDFAKDALITRDFTGELSMELLKEKISRFSLGQHEFVKIEPDSGSSMRPGFYELLYSGPASVLVKRTNQVVRVTQREDEPGKLSADRQFAEYDDYYVLKNGQYIPVRGEADLLNVLKDHRAELRKFLARRPKSYRKDPAAAIVAAVSYYEQLKN